MEAARRRAARAGPSTVGVPDLLAATLGPARPDVRLLADAAAREEVVDVTGITLDEAARRLDAVARKETR